jgi:ribosomal protein S14
LLAIRLLHEVLREFSPADKSSLHRHSGRRTHRSAVCARSARAGQLRKLRLTRALLRTHTHLGPGSVYRRGSSPADSRFPPPPEWKCFLWKIFQLFQPTGSDPSPKIWAHVQVGGVCEEFMSNISATCGRQDMRFCVRGSPSGDLSHIASLTISCSL